MILDFCRHGLTVCSEVFVVICEERTESFGLIYCKHHYKMQYIHYICCMCGCRVLVVALLRTICTQSGGQHFNAFVSDGNPGLQTR